MTTSFLGSFMGAVRFDPILNLADGPPVMFHVMQALAQAASSADLGVVFRGAAVWADKCRHACCPARAALLLSSRFGMIRLTLPHNSCTCQARRATCLVAALGAALSSAFDPPLPLNSSTCQAHRATCLVAAHGAALLPAFDPSLGFGLPLAAPAWRDLCAEVKRVRYAEPRARPRVFVRVDRARLKDGAPPRFDTRKGSLASRQGLLGGYLGSEMSWVGLKTVRHDSSRLETKGNPGPNARWKAAPVAWPRWSGRDRLAAFARGGPIRPQCTKKWMQVLAGRWDGHQLVKSTTCCSFSALWSQLGRWPRAQRFPDSSAGELLCCIALLPKMMVVLSVPCSGIVTCSDASLTGGAVCSSRGVTPAGMKAVTRWLGRGITPGDEKAGLLAIFDGIGGARRALELIGCGVAIYMSSKVDPPEMRMVHYARPTRFDMGPVQTITGKRVEQLLHAYTRVRRLYEVARFPCKGFSSANPGAMGLANAQSMRERDLACVGISVCFCAESVASINESDQVHCTRLLGCAPLEIDASEIIHARRQRLLW